MVTHIAWWVNDIFSTFCVILRAIAHIVCYYWFITKFGGNEIMLGEKIKELRERENYSQKELGLKLGISPSTVGMYEQNRRSPG